MLSEAKVTFNQNMERVENLVSIYHPKNTKAKQGKKAVGKTDILRAAIVFLHASMEDFLRQLLIHNIDNFSKDVLSKYGFPSEEKRVREKINLGDLAEYRGRTIDEFIRDSVLEKIEFRSTFNSIEQVTNELVKCGVSEETLKKVEFQTIGEMIRRRHEIVHKSDKNPKAGKQGHQIANSINIKSVNEYIRSTKNLVNLILIDLER